MTLEELIAELLAGNERLTAALCVALDGRVHAGTADVVTGQPDNPDAAQEERLAPLRETAEGEV